MFRKFRELKDAPKATREQYAFLYAAVITLIIAGIWMVSLPSQFADVNATADTDRVTTNANASSFSRVFKDVKAQFASVFSSLRADVSEVEDLIETSEREPEQTAPADTAIDISAMFATSSEAATTAPARQAPPRTVLIATTTATTSVGQND